MSVMLLRLPVIVSALAFVLASVMAPHQHLHGDSGVQHTHVTPHQHGHHHDDAPSTPVDHDHHGEEEGTIVSVVSFLAAGAVSVDAGGAAMAGPALAIVDSEIRVTKIIASPEPHAHGPPAARSLTPRAPPV